MLKFKSFAAALFSTSVFVSCAVRASLPIFKEDSHHNGEVLRHFIRLGHQIEERLDDYKGRSIQYLPLETAYAKYQEFDPHRLIQIEQIKSYRDFLAHNNSLFCRENIDISTIPSGIRNIFRSKFGIFRLPHTDTVLSYALNLKEQLSQICECSRKKGFDNLAATRLLKRISLICNSNAIYNPLTKFLEEESATLKWVGVLDLRHLEFTEN